MISLSPDQSVALEALLGAVVLDASFLAAEARDPDLFRRLLYTAATRAADSLTIWEV